MTPAIKDLFNCLTDGLAIVSPDGNVRFANQAMNALLQIDLRQPFPLAPVAALVDQAQLGHLSLPHRFETELAHDPQVADPDVLIGHVVRSPVGADVVIVIHDITESRIYSAAIANLAILIEQNLIAPFDRFAEDFAALITNLPASTHPPITAQRDAVVSQGKVLLRQLHTLSAFVMQGRGNRLDGTDRIELNSWLAATLGSHMESASRRGIRMTLLTGARELPVLYGSRHWLSEALSACIDNAIRHSDNGSEVMLSATAFDRFVRVDIKNHGRQLRSPLLRNRLSRPLMRSKRAEEDGIGLGLGLPLARNIIEAYKGRLVLEQDLEGFVTCSIELPAGAGSNAPPDTREAQALRYARDLARLMNMRNKKNPSRPDRAITST